MILKKRKKKYREFTSCATAVMMEDMLPGCAGPDQLFPSATENLNLPIKVHLFRQEMQRTHTDAGRTLQTPHRKVPSSNPQASDAEVEA